MITSQIITLAVLAVIVVVILGGFAAVTFINPQRTARDRIQELTTGKKEEASSVMDFRAIRSVTNQVSKLAAPTDDDQGHLLRRKLSQAGFRARNNLEVFSAARAGLALALPMMFAFFLPEMSTVKILGVVLGLATVGYYLPGFIVESQIEKRQKEIMSTFPDALDLLVSSVEAGLGLDAAFRRVAEELGEAAPMLSGELQTVNHEVTAGVPRIEALKNFEQRIGVDDVRALVNVLAQAERFGTSVARALRNHADLVRTKRQLLAEEKAAQISPKLTVVMILFVMPSLFSVLLGPAVVLIARNFIGK